MATYELETIPIWDAFEAESECTLCLLDEGSEERYLKFFLGNSVMVPELRVEVNRRGFCPRHFQALWGVSQSRHPLSLLAHTHLLDLIDSSRAREKRVVSSKRGRNIGDYVAHLRGREMSCMICDRIQSSLDRYNFTIVYLWRSDAEFRDALLDSKGFCFHHLQGLLEMARAEIGRRHIDRFVAEIFEVQNRELGRIEDELNWYTQNFDHANHDKPWGSSRDALHRALQKITGKIFRDRQ